MHEALLVPEILILIFRELGLQDLGLQDLTTVAVVCQAWQGWAMEVKWGRSKVPLEKLVRVLPNEIIASQHKPTASDSSELPKDNLGNTLELKDHIPRLFRYSQLVTSLHINPFMGVSYDTMFRILQVAGTLYSPLFPRLRHLTVTASYQFNKPLNDVVNLFAEYPLLSITLPCCNYITPFTKGWTVNLCLPDLFTKDRSQIRHFESELVIDPTQYSLATSLPRLEVLRYNCVPTRALWLEMGRLPNLTQLRVNVGQRQDTLTSEDLVLFPILRQLSIFLDEQSGTLPNNILLRTSMPSLRRLCIESCNDIEDMTAVCQHLKKHSPLLDSFELYAFGFVRTREIAQQTLQLKGLRRLTLGLDADTAIMDDDIVALAPLMTRLEMLSIWAMGVWVSKTSLMTVKGIITLAEHALCLVDLCITLDVRRFEIQEMSQNPPSFPRLKSLRLGIHRDSDTRHEACAGFLARVCPTVEYLHLPRGPTLRNSDEQRDWDEGFRSEYWAAREKG